MATATREDVKSLRREIDSLRKEVGRRYAWGRERLGDVGKRARETARDARARAREQIGGAYETAREYGETAVEKSREEVREWPLTSLMLVFAAGLVLGALMRERR